MQLSVISLCQSDSVGDFIESWKKYHDYKFANYYDSIQSRTDFSEEQKLVQYFWSYSKRLGVKSDKEFKEKMLSKVPELLEIRESKYFNEDGLLEHFSDVPILWRFFFMHIINADEYPIFDAHVYRAYNHIACCDSTAFPSEDKYRLIAYRKEYKPFFQGLKVKCDSHTVQELDKALWGLGQFLKTFPRAFNPPREVNDTSSSSSHVDRELKLFLQRSFFPVGGMMYDFFKVK